ncbi:hypothetical protein PILCRDRAFT_8703 [Piloderma croceum F 1598]|uniref:Uncharacterized protein n=1 Tax=Piloderma croceum (strain F 1598) TaxID=765440 RepID=A0A0C3F9K3_PILCF|nr:hypothetical protein PILCRDRAFT_8703 [Piloderma croceum F 1598]
MPPDNAHLFVVGANMVRRIERFAKGPMRLSWRLNEKIQMSDNVSSTRLTVMMEYSLYNFQQLGFMNLVRTDVMLKCELVQMLMRTSGGPALELVCHVNTDLFKDIFEEEAFKQQVYLTRSWGQTLQDSDLVHLVADVKYDHALSLSNENTEKPWRLMRARDMFLRLYTESQKTTDLDKTITVYETGVRIMQDSHECQADVHAKLGGALRAHSVQTPEAQHNRSP